MTETMIDLPGVIAKSDDTDFLRELIQDAAQRLMDIEVAAVCGAYAGERESGSVASLVGAANGVLYATMASLVAAIHVCSARAI